MTQQPTLAEPAQYRRCTTCGYVLAPNMPDRRCPSCSRGTEFTPTTIIFPVRPSDEALARDTRPVEAEIRAAYRRLARQPGEIVPLTRLRAALPAGLSRETVDAALSKLAAHDDVHLSPASDHHQTDPTTQAAALQFGGGYDHTIAIEHQPSPAGVLARVRSTDPVHAASMLAPLDEHTLSYVAQRMGLDPTGPAATIRQRIATQAAANHTAWLADAEQGRLDGTLLYRADTDPQWVATWTDDDRHTVQEAAARLLTRADTNPQWAYVRDRAQRWANS